MATIDSAVIGSVIKEVIGAGIAWGKGLKKPKPGRVKEKVHALVDEAANRASIADSLPPEGMARLVSSITELTLPTFEQVVKFSPNTYTIYHAAGGAKKQAPKKLSAKVAYKKAMKKTMPKKAGKKAAAKKASAKKAVRK